MITRVREFAISFFPAHVSRQIRELYLAVGIGNLAVSAVMIFEPIYLYQLGYSIPAIIGFYAVVYILYLLLMPMGAARALWHGYEPTILVSSIFLVGFYLSFLGVTISVLFLPLAAIFYALQKAFYWPSFYYGFSSFGQDDEEGREVGNWEVLEVVVSAIGPFLGGLLLYLSNFATLFVVASVLILVSNLPLILTREVSTPTPFSYRDCFRRLLNPEKRRLVISIFGFGEEIVVLMFWPLFIYIAYIGDLFSLGSLIAGTTAVTVVIILYIGRLTDQADKRVVLRSSSFLYALIWWLRLFLSGVGSVVLVDTLSRLTKKMFMVPLMSLVLERARHRQHAMATAVLFEQSLAIGKLLMLFFTALFFIFVPEIAWQLTFTMAGAFTLLYFFL